MASGRSTDKSSEASTSVDICESDTPEPSSTSAGSEIKSQKDFLVHKVSKFDTLAGLAIRYGVSVHDIKKANGLLSDSSMFARQSLVIPLNPSSDDKFHHGEKSRHEIGSRLDRPYSMYGEPSTSQRLDISPRASNNKFNKAPYFSSGLETNLFSRISDPETHSTSEIELEIMDEEKTQSEEAFRRRKKENEVWRNSDTTSLFGRPPVPPKSTSSYSFSDYFSAMAQSFVKQSELLFGATGKWTTSNTSETFFTKFKKLTQTSESSGSFPSGSTSRMQGGMGGKKSPSDSSLSAKDVSKLD